jgi:hypothetical protein
MNTPPGARYSTTALTSIHYLAMNEATPTVPRAAKEIKLTTSQEAKFWAKVNKDGPTMPHMESPCWLWTGGKSKSGYGSVTLNGKSFSPHRVAWMIANGPIPHDGSHHGICVCHRCDRRDCCRADHTFLGTIADNLHDMAIKGRAAKGDKHGSRLHPERMARGDRSGSRLHPERLARGDTHYARVYPEKLARGEAHGRSKLTATQVVEIRALRAAGGTTLKKLGAQFGVSDAAINLIIRRKKWKHVP